MKRRVRNQVILVLLAAAIPFALPKLVFPHWQEGPLDKFLDVLGVLLVLFGFLFRISARGYKEEKSAQGKNLVKDGPYKLIRHPMYFGTLLIGTGTIFVLFELWTLFLFIFFYFLIYIPQVKKEESMLSERFGEEYKNYCKAVPRNTPRLRDLLNLKDYLSLKLSWIKKELFSLTMIISAILAVETWEDIRLFGNKEFVKEFLGLFSIIVSFVVIIALFLKNDTNHSDR